MTTSATPGSSTSRSNDSGRRSRSTPRTRRSSRRFAAPATRPSAEPSRGAPGIDEPGSMSLGGVRARLTVTIVALVVLTAVVLGLGSYAFVDGRLHDQTLQEAADQARFDLSVLIPSRLEVPPSETAMAQLGADFQGRGLRTIIVDSSGRAFGTPASLSSDYATIPASVRALVDHGELAYAWQPM